MQPSTEHVSANYAADKDANALAAAIHTRRVIKCRRVYERHTEGGNCPSCGL